MDNFESGGVVDENALKKYVMVYEYRKYLYRSVKNLKDDIARLDCCINKALLMNETTERLLSLKDIRTKKMNALYDLLSTVEAFQAEIVKMLADAKNILTPAEHIIIHLLYIEGLNMCEIEDKLQTDKDLSRFMYTRSQLFRIKESALVKLKFKNEQLNVPSCFDTKTEPYCIMCGSKFKASSATQWSCAFCRRDTRSKFKNERFCKRCGQSFDRSKIGQGKYCLKCLKEKGEDSKR